jgi:hypothetical protein
MSYFTGLFHIQIPEAYIHNSFNQEYINVRDFMSVPVSRTAEFDSHQGYKVLPTPLNTIMITSSTALWVSTSL